LAVSGFAAAAEGFRAGDFRSAGFAAFGALAEGLERRAGFLAGLDAGFVFRVGMGKASVQVYQRSRAGRRSRERQAATIRRS
jgi:hypothetical protein